MYRIQTADHLLQLSQCHRPTKNKLGKEIAVRSLNMLGIERSEYLSLFFIGFLNIEKR